MTRDRERGSASIEAAIGVPAFMGFLALIIAGGRVAMAHEAVTAAAADAARSASLARTQGAAHAAAPGAANASLDNQQVNCSTRSVTLDISGFARPVGAPATVSATVQCTVDLADVAIPGMPGHRTITATMTSPLDTFRERT
jgi:Flp pilus assembly protein TadG